MRCSAGPAAASCSKQSPDPNSDREDPPVAPVSPGKHPSMRLASGFVLMAVWGLHCGAQLSLVAAHGLGCSAARGRSTSCDGRRILNAWTTSDVPGLPFRCQLTNLCDSPVTFSLMLKGLTVCIESTVCGSEDGIQVSLCSVVAALLHLGARESPDTTLPSETPARPF